MSGQGVLIVEDDESIRDLLTVLLQEEGSTVFTAPDGQPALERLRMSQRASSSCSLS